MLVIHKYILEDVEKQTIQLPAKSKIINIAEQNDKVAVWAIVDNAEPLIDIEILCLGTGDSVHVDAFNTHLATIRRYHFVFHYFLSKPMPSC